MNMAFNRFWYIACESRELKAGQVLARKILNENLAIYRDADGQPVVLQDRCAHRAAKLSSGRVNNGRLVCQYHGWTYGPQGDVVRIPSDSPEDLKRSRACGKKYPVIEQEGYIYTCLAEPLLALPFAMPCHGKKGYSTLRLKHRFQNTVTNCVENFVDIPHTTFVHPGVFRYDRRQRLTAHVERREGTVRAEYGRETGNFGIFSKFLNPRGREIRHVDEFHMPNVTSVHYHFGGERHFIITSQSVPVSGEETLVYTDLTYNYGIWNYFVRPIVFVQAKIIIYQDVQILREQMDVIQKYGVQFNNSRSDIIHDYIESIRDEIERGGDPRALPEKSVEIEFWI